MVFVSHSSQDDALVAQLCEALALRGVHAWRDSRHLAAGDRLRPEIEQAIRSADVFLVVLTQTALPSRWVEREVQFALGLGKPVIPLLCAPLTPAVLSRYFPEEPVAIQVPSGPGGIEAALPDLFQALGLELGDDPDRDVPKVAAPIADLMLVLEDPRWQSSGGEPKAAATASLHLVQPDGSPHLESPSYTFVAPLGPIDNKELSWYLEHYSSWPGEPFRYRAKEIERLLPLWGKRLYDALPPEAAEVLLREWRAASNAGFHRRFTVYLPGELLDRQAAAPPANSAAASLLALPWELIHDGQSYLFEGGQPVRARRRLKTADGAHQSPVAPPIRVLMVTPRPEDESVSYVDHRAESLAVVTALLRLGSLAELTILRPPTFPALVTELDDAIASGRPYHIIHFDGPSVYDHENGISRLCLEEPGDVPNVERRRPQLTEAHKFAAVLRDRDIPLVFLSTFGAADANPTSSVAAELVRSGVGSVVAMSHLVLTQTAQRFVEVFYESLLKGERVGDAMTAGQRALYADKKRGRAFRGTDLEVDDWFVPVLYQEEQDPQLVTAVPGERVQTTLADLAERALGDLPELPHGFVGRSRELLQIERLLEQRRWVTLRGAGGEGKSAIAIEAVRWLVASGRFQRAAFVNVETYDNPHAVLTKLGSQLVPDYLEQSANQDPRGVLLVERELKAKPTLIVLDNIESVLPDVGLLDKRLIGTAQTRIILTTREPLPAPYVGNEILVGRLDRADAIELVARVLAERHWTMQFHDNSDSEEAIGEFVDIVNCHARALVLLAPEVAASGVSNAGERLRKLIFELERDYPDNRERSLIASLRLSLDRLPQTTRQKIRPLGVFQDGASISAISLMLEMESEEAEDVARQLVRFGLATMPEGYLYFDPALCAVLSSELSPEERESARNRWAAIMAQFIRSIDDVRIEDPFLSYRVAILELRNLVASVEYISQTSPPERTVDLAARLESVIAPLQARRAMARVESIRQEAQRHLAAWTSAAFLAGSIETKRLIRAGNFATAVDHAAHLLARSETEGPDAYEGAALDIAQARLDFGDALREAGSAERALEHLQKARDEFLDLEQQLHHPDAGRVADLALSRIGLCWLALGRIQDARSAFGQVMSAADKRQDFRSFAANAGHLGKALFRDRNYQEALQYFEIARKVFQELGENDSAAAYWSLSGKVYGKIQDTDRAEEAFRQALALNPEPMEEAAILSDLGLLYGSMKRWENAARFHQEAAKILNHCGDRLQEGRTRNDVAMCLFYLKRFDEARAEVLLSLECKAPFGTTAMSWTTFSLLRDIERESGDPGAAADAHQQATEAYLAYRQQGGRNEFPSGALLGKIARLMRNGQAQGALDELEQQAPSAQPFGSALRAVIQGNRDRALADDPRLDYDEAAEIILLLERFQN